MLYSTSPLPRAWTGDPGENRVSTSSSPGGGVDHSLGNDWIVSAGKAYFARQSSSSFDPSNLLSHLSGRRTVGSEAG